MTTVLEHLNQALHQSLNTDKNVLVMGEDILDPYGGAFKVTRGLSTAFPARVLTTPVSEAGIVGVAAGMALRGLRPVVEIMFGDFTTLIADQLVNSIAKFRWMYNDQVRVPLVIRTPMGGRRGYGPTHSQTLEKLFFGVPGLIILAPCAFGDPGQLLSQAILQEDDPVLFIENKLLYLTPIHAAGDLGDLYISTSLPPESGEPEKGTSQVVPYAPTYTVTVSGAPPAALTLVAYGYMAELAQKAVLQLAFDHELFVELITPTQLSPLQIDTVMASSHRTGRLLTVEEGNLSFGWGAEVVARVAEGSEQKLAVRRLGALDTPIPASLPLEEITLPGVEAIVQAARDMV